MNKNEMIEALNGKIAELEDSIAAGKAEEKLVGRFKRQVRPLYVIRELIAMLDSDDIRLATQKDFTQLIECSKGVKRYDLRDGMSLADVLKYNPNLSMKKLEKHGFVVDYAKGIIVKR